MPFVGRHDSAARRGTVPRQNDPRCALLRSRGEAIHPQSMHVVQLALHESGIAFPPKDDVVRNNLKAMRNIEAHSRSRVIYHLLVAMPLHPATEQICRVAHSMQGLPSHVLDIHTTKKATPAAQQLQSQLSMLASGPGKACTSVQRLKAQPR